MPAAGASAWVHGGSFTTYPRARAERNSRLEELRRRWDEEHAALKTLVQTLKIKAEYNDGMASRYQAAQTRLRRFEEAGPPQQVPNGQKVTMRLRGGRTGKRAVVCERLELTGLMKPFDAEIWFGERVAVLGSNGSGKSHVLRLLAAGGSDPEPEHRPVDEVVVEPVAHSGRARLGAGVVGTGSGLWVTAERIDEPPATDGSGFGVAGLRTGECVASSSIRRSVAPAARNRSP